MEAVKQTQSEDSLKVAFQTLQCIRPLINHSVTSLPGKCAYPIAGPMGTIVTTLTTISHVYCVDGSELADGVGVQCYHCDSRLESQCKETVSDVDGLQHLIWDSCSKCLVRYVYYFILYIHVLNSLKGY